MSKERKSMTKREVIKEISTVTKLKPEIVKSVIDCYSDIFVREAILTGSFYLPNCFIIETNKRKARKQYNVNKGIYEEYPETEVLTIRLSKKIHNYNRWKQRHKYNEEHGLTVEDWRKRQDGKLPSK